MRWPLRNQILLPFLLVLLVVMAAASALNAWLAAQQSGRQIERQMHEVGASLKSANFPLTTAILAQTKTLSGADFALLNAQSETIASTLKMGSEAARLASLPMEQAGSIGKLTLSGEGYFHTAVRPRQGDGWLHILYPERAWREARWRAALPPLVVGLGAMGVMVLVAYSIAEQLSRPIHRLEEQVRRIAAGEFEELPLPPRNDEIRDLATSVNSLVKELVGMTQAIQRSERLAVMGQLSGGLAHHLRNAITGARLAVQLHQRSCRSDDDESLQVANRQLRLTEEHLQRFLTAGQPQHPDKRPCLLPAVLEEVALLIRPLASHHQTQFEMQTSELAATTVDADPKLLEQMLLNLVLNAIEAAGPGGWVRVEGTLDNGVVQLRIVDSGPGPPDSVRDRLFEPFATGKREGIGLGLVAARTIARSHDGELRFLGDRPTCFEFTMKVAAAR